MVIRRLTLLLPLLLLLLIGFTVRPLAAEQVETFPIMRGTPHETTCTIKRGEADGPTVFIIGGMHGDETAGYLAARKLTEWTITTGTLILIPDSHITAIRANKRDYPANMNKQFPGDAQGTTMQRAAAEIWGLIKQHKPDLLVTLHESIGLYRDNPARFGQTLTYDFPELTPTFQPIVDEINQQLASPREQFHLKVHACRGCPTDCAWRFLKIPAVTVETTRTMPLAERVRQQLLVCAIMMQRWGLQWETGTGCPEGQGTGCPEGTGSPCRERGGPVAARHPTPDSAAPDVRDHITHLATTLGPRPGGSSAEGKALDYCRQQFMEMGYEPQVQTVPLWHGLTSQNVIATLPGDADEVVIGAHADSVAWSPGANDNASGVALTLELARHFRSNPLPHTMRFIIFGAEEGRYAKGKVVTGTGRAGSRYYVHNLTEEQRRSIKVMVNLDQVAGGPGLRVGDMSDHGDPPAQQCLQIARGFGIPLTFITFAGKSDYRPFHDRGIPVVSFDCGRDPLTHKQTDTPEKLQYEKLDSVFQVVVAYLTGV